VASPITTSAGRLFDAVAALCGVRSEVNYEGQAAAELEAAASPDEGGAYELPVVGAEPPLLLDAREVVRLVVRDLHAGVALGTVATRFHNGLADCTAAACVQLASRHGLGTAVLSGGVFQNRLLLERTTERLERAGLRVLIPELLPPNDGGIGYGQAAIAAARGH
jgi:hydrogenase maturation protein HypF